MKEKTKALLAAALALVMLAALGCAVRWRVLLAEPVVTDEVIFRNMERTAHMDEPEATLPPEPVVIEADADVILLAKIMQAEDGHEWPDSMIMCIGEVVLNRVASPEFPDTVREVLYQADDGFIQYAPVHKAGWERSEPEARYIELARRLLNGERVLSNPQIVYQALFEQGRGTVMSYRDIYLGTTTYFCLTDSPGLYG